MLHELTIYQKMYDLILYAFPIINKMPRNSRFTLCQKIIDEMLDIAMMISWANREKDKRRTLWEIDGRLDQLRLLIRLAKDLSLLNYQSYGQMTERITEIGRLLGGWMKAFAGHG